MLKELAQRLAIIREAREAALEAAREAEQQERLGPLYAVIGGKTNAGIEGWRPSPEAGSEAKDKGITGS